MPLELRRFPLLCSTLVALGCPDDGEETPGGTTTTTEGTTTTMADTTTGGSSSSGGQTTGIAESSTGTLTAEESSSGSSTTASQTTGTGTTGGTNTVCDDDAPPPVAYYPFNECSTIAQEATGTGLDLDLDSASCEAEDALSSAIGMSWSSGTALSCSADPPECASSPDNATFEPAAFTLAAWVYNDDWSTCGDDGTPGEETCTIASKANTDFDSNGYWFRISAGTGTPHVAIGIAAGGAATEYGVEGGELSDGTWHHVVATFDGTTAAIYLDGTPVGSVDTDGITYGDEDFLVGAMTNRGYSHSGLIDELKLWDYVKDAAEVAALYAAYEDC